MIQFVDFNDWYRYVKIEVEKQNKSFQNDELDFHNKYDIEYDERDSSQYLDVIAFRKFVDLLSEDFNYKIIEVINTWELINYSNHWFEHFYIIRHAVRTNLELKYQYKYPIPYGDDEKKYKDKISTLEKRALKKKINIMLPALSPKNNLVFFRCKCDELLNKFDFFHNTKISRIKQIRKKELINSLIGVIVCDNFYKDFRNELRLTIKSKNMYRSEMKKIQEK